MHMSKNNIFKENFQRYIDGFYSKNELESILKQIKNYCTDEDIDQLTEQLWSNLGDETLANRFEKATCEKEAWKLLNEFWAPMELPFEKERIEIRNQNVYYLPPASNHYKGIHFVRNGLFLGELKKNRFEPSEPLALALSQEQFPAILNLSSEEERVTRYLRGETLLIEEGEAKVKKGWQLVCVDGHPLGFGKLVNQTLKNKYPAGWRRNS